MDVEETDGQCLERPGVVLGQNRSGPTCGVQVPQQILPRKCSSKGHQYVS